MKRYANISTTTIWNGKQAYLTTQYPIITPSPSDLRVAANEGDYLDTLAYKYYGDPTLWFIIALANPGVGKGRLSVIPGTILRIPTNINNIIDQFNRLNSTSS